MDTVEGVALALSEDQFEILDEHHRDIDQYRASLLVKPTDLGPLYQEPVLAEAYITAVDSPAEYLDVHSGPREWVDQGHGDDWDFDALNSLAWNIYVHNRL